MTLYKYLPKDKESFIESRDAIFTREEMEKLKLKYGKALGNFLSDSDHVDRVLKENMMYSMDMSICYFLKLYEEGSYYLIRGYPENPPQPDFELRRWNSGNPPVPFYIPIPYINYKAWVDKDLAGYVYARYKLKNHWERIVKKEPLNPC